VTGTNHFLKIGNFARIAKTNLRTLRYYEELGLLQPALRSEGGFRYYRPTDLNRVQMIQNLQQLGLPLEQIRELIGTRSDCASRQPMVDRVLHALNEQERLIDDHIRSLEEQKKKIAEAKDKLVECRTCEHCPTAHNNFCQPCMHTGLALPEFLSALY
jgi:DNA-binding transcriptional MerR regulator